MSALQERLERRSAPEPTLDLDAVPSDPGGRSGSPAWLVAPLVAIAVLVPLHHLWAAQALLLGLLLIAPGMLLLRALRVSGLAIVEFPVYVPAASLLVLTGSGLAVDLLLPLFGVDQPLRAVPLLAGLEVVLAGLAVAASRAPETARIPWALFEPKLRAAWPLALPAIAAAGAALLSNGHGNTVAIIAAVLSLLALCVGVVWAHRMNVSQLSLLIYGVALATIWAFTLRGQFVYGFDIAGEFHVLETTNREGIWHVSHSGDAYGAMLSLTILPTLLHSLTGLHSLFLLKVVYPALFALFPVALFGLANRFVAKRWAFVAAAFITVQTYFFQQLPAIARQEIALVLFIALIAALFERRMPSRSRWALVSLFGLTLVVSHYSTTYLAIALFLGALVLQLVGSLIRPMPRITGSLVAALAVTAIGAAVWYAPVTHSSDNVSSFTKNVRERGLDLLPNAKPGENLLQSYLSGNQPKRETALDYERTSEREYLEQKPYVTPLGAASERKYDLVDAPSNVPKVKLPALRNGLSSLQTVVSQLAYLLAIAGALILVLRRRTSPGLRLISLLGLSTLIVLVFVRLSGTAANSYNQERAFVQTMVPLSIGMAWALQALGKRFGPPGRLKLLGPVVVAAALGLLFVTGTGLRNAVLGGGAPVNLADKGEDYERFYVTPPELAAARWLEAVPKRALIYTDRYGQLRVLGATGRSQGLLLDTTPDTLDHNAWVYASRTNVLGRARGDADGKFTIYRWPQRFLDEQYNRVYTNGSSEVFHR